MALKRMAVQRIDANAVSFPRTTLLSRVQPEFKDCAQADGAGPFLSRGCVSLPPWLGSQPQGPSSSGALHVKLFLQELYTQ